MDWVNLLGYAAAASVLATFCMRTMIPIRILALVSNVLFCLYGYLDNLYPVLILHLVLFPVSLYRLIQFQRLVHELQVVDPADLSIQSWIPHMKLRRMKAGETLIRQGDRVNSIYYLLDGKLEIPELGKTLDPGAVVCEIGVFASDAKRTANVVCRTDCRIYELSENQAKQLFLQDRKFGLVMLRLSLDRLLENNRRLLEAASQGLGVSASR